MTSTIKKHLYLIALSWVLLNVNESVAQSREWEIDRIEVQERARKQAFDSSLVHLKNRWEVKLGFGIWNFNKASRSTNDQAPEFSGSMNVWQLAGVWHFSEKLFTELTIGFQLKKDVPTPDIQSILNGDDIELEGAAVIFLPVDIGLRYYFTKNRFRPLVGISTGFVVSNYRYIVAEGDINSGIDQTNFDTNDRAGLAKLIAGFDYRTGKRTHLRMDTAYGVSSGFATTIGGYNGYSGFSVNFGLGVVF